MAVCTVIVDKLNQRKCIPVQFTDMTGVTGTVYKGYAFEGTEVPAAELPDTQLGKWYKDKDGNFYWGGGLVTGNPTNQSENMPANTIAFDPNKMSWGHRYYDIPFIWQDLGTKGKGVTVAVIDTGVDDLHPDLTNLHPLSKSFTASTIRDTDGHGTNMAGIIGAAGNKLVYGVSPEAKLLVIKVSDTARGANSAILTSALDYVYCR